MYKEGFVYKDGSGCKQVSFIKKEGSVYKEGSVCKEHFRYR